MSTPPTFTELVDWVDGRLDQQQAADVESRVATGGEETSATVDWIREFKAAAELMPLVAPPEHVRSPSATPSVDSAPPGQARSTTWVSTSTAASPRWPGSGPAHTPRARSTSISVALVSR